MTTTRPSYSSKMEGRVRLSWGSGELQTEQGQASVGTPVEVPVPRNLSIITLYVFAASAIP
jgi:hypothetical protein